MPNETKEISLSKNWDLDKVALGANEGEEGKEEEGERRRRRSRSPVRTTHYYGLGGGRKRPEKVVMLHECWNCEL